MSSINIRNGIALHTSQPAKKWKFQLLKTCSMFLPPTTNRHMDGVSRRCMAFLLFHSHPTLCTEAPTTRTRTQTRTRTVKRILTLTPTISITIILILTLTLTLNLNPNSNPKSQNPNPNPNPTASLQVGCYRDTLSPSVILGVGLITVGLRQVHGWVTDL